MAKSNIIKQLVNEEITLSVALKRLLILANDLNISELANWVRNETRGYKASEVPDYRKIKSYTFHYAGLNGSFKVGKASLSCSFFNKQTLEDILENPVTESISDIEEKSKVIGQELMIDRSYLAGEVYKNSSDGWNNGIQCTNIYQIFYPEQFKNICNKVSAMALDILLELDKKFGNLDELDLDSTKLNKKDIDEAKRNIQVIINYSPITVEKDLNIKSENAVLGDGQINKATDNKKIKDSNTGIGTNVVDKKFTPTLSIDGETIKKIIKGN
jgi:hypothetical protein